MKETTFTIRFRWNMLKKDENKLIIWGGDFFFSCLFFWEKIINTVQSEQFSLTVVSLEVCEPSLLIFQSHCQLFTVYTWAENMNLWL